ncbi:LacI family transcriptional regulator, partial [Escherichia coli]|nr:LacI family transcriptional regulator [Escherichia coli]
DIDMFRQDVPAMLEKVFEIVDSGDTTLRRIEIPPQLIPSLNVVS